jgi:predicted dehydrogenase
MSDPVRVAILGAGRIGKVHMQSYKRIRDKVQVCALVEARKKLAESRAAEWGVEKYFQTLDELLPNEPCDAVDICLPHNVHVECVQKACAGGKHVLLEKPIARTLADADQIIEAAQRAGVTLMVAHNHV